MLFYVKMQHFKVVFVIQGDDGSEGQFVVVGALQSEEEQAGGAAVEPPTSSHLAPLVPLVSQQSAHQPLPSTQDYNSHVSVG